MPREQLQLLAADVDRLLAAGAAVAAGDEGLRRRGKALREFGQKVPVLVQITDAVDRAVNAPPKQVTPALLDLLLIVRQVRGSLAAAGASGDVTPVEASGPWASPAPLRDVEEWLDTLNRSGQQRVKLLKQAVARPDFIDVRLVDPLLKALGSTHRTLAHTVAAKALPAFGKAVLPELERGLDLPKGKAADARRLLAICVLDAKKGAALCRQALAEGSAPVKVQGLRNLSRIAPSETEDAALALLQAKDSEAVHAAAYYALATARSDAALEALLGGLLQPTKWRYWHLTHTSLRKLAHPKTTARLLEELAKFLERVKELSAKKGNKKAPAAKGKGQSKTAQAKAAQKEARLLDETINATCRLIALLGARRDKTAMPTLTALLQHSTPNIRGAAAEALITLREQAGLETVATLGEDKLLWHCAIRAAWALPAKERFDWLAPALATLSAAKPAQRSRGDTVLGFFHEQFWRLGAEGDLDEAEDEDEDEDDSEVDEDEAEDLWEEEDLVVNVIPDWDPRWVPALRKHLNGPSRNSVAVALTVLERAKFAPELLRLLVPSATKGEIGVMQALGWLGVKEAVKPLLGLLSVRTANHYWVVDALERLGDPSIMPQLQALLNKAKDSWKKRQLEDLIEHLEKQA
ncbi:MAG TPA: HEAT repeat domain-containing protein [Gemmataceae bacterium]|nr:HEAT repeat domain-containing protein [Gemmataceae bacterium]